MRTLVLLVLFAACANAKLPAWQNTGYSRSYGSPASWQRYLNGGNAVPAWTHYRENTAYTRRPGVESIGHYLNTGNRP